MAATKTMLNAVPTDGGAEKREAMRAKLRAAGEKLNARAALRRLVTDLTCTVVGDDGELRYCDDATEIIQAETILDEYRTLPGLHALAGLDYWLAHNDLEDLQSFFNAYIDDGLDEDDRACPPSVEDIEASLETIANACRMLEDCASVLNEMMALVAPADTAA